MTGALLVRGMLVGLVAGLLMFGFGATWGEPAVERAIAFEAAHGEAAHQAHADHDHGPALVSRPVQAGPGLLTGVLVYAAAFGGLFALVFAVAHGRATPLGPRGTSALLAACGFVAVYVVPSLKYPANPPAVGEADTIGQRTALFFIMLAVSVAAAAAAAALRHRLARRHGGWNAAVAALAAFVAIVAVAGVVLPVVDEVPDGFPADLLWQFRMASAGMQLVLWATLGLGFGVVAERALGGRTVRPGWPGALPVPR